jgi:ParB family chromosome partitioning protein
VLKALRQGQLTLKQVRLFARLPDKKQQAEIAQTALDGHFQDYQLRHVIERDRITIDDDRFTLVGMHRYVAAGGRVSTDRFGDLPDCLLDPEILQTA